MDKFKQQIQAVINGFAEDVTSENLISPDVVVKYLESIGFTKGYVEWDDSSFMVPLTKDGINYYINGDGYYNKGITFFKEEE